MNTSIIKTKHIGEGTTIGEFCVIGENVKIGKNCKIYNNVSLSGHTTIGDGTSIFPYAALGNPPQDLKYKGEKTELIIGKNNMIREFTMFSPGTGEGGKTLIGDNNLFMAYVHIAHDCVIGNDCVFANCATLGGHIHIGNQVNIGGLSAIHQFVNIGDGCMLAGASAVSQDIPPYCLAEGNRATIRGLNKYKMRRVFSYEEIDEISHIYKILLSGDKPIKELAAEFLETTTRDSIRYICKFIIDSKRGIPYKRGIINE
ncbi:acyl-[acyl-carrier-protein]--UDP-N-acetylglucosamine O-acyltransferase [Helicobacter sp. 16-1353]|uniref:acyl-ACP--UDP-N-acetylglucosamine O-acyltransferase n=1 Tax=Helicobacter sp. 16-1353 TaxID=2004996 RepID=UPI000DCEBB48|nr:acyl-ACP--UDP-N-acetylglucosamine O-acyltransferase [Helicobacter sp. 16-1353]RAX55347.1 acyl-[acyl-carrier-protein]--UDP-N-acetylglucosamine O-acyltransferase [Helicobacter sp. 16-1353]